MPQITPALLLAFVTLLFSVSGCGDTSSKVVFSTDSGKHPANWKTVHNASARAAIESCLECHGEALDGGISQVSCMSATPVSGFICHATNPTVNQPGCVSCHGGLPNGPFGTAAPNRKFAHGKHTALTGCGTCHLNAGSGSAGHASASATGGFRTATVTLANSAKAKTVTTFGYTAATGTCASVSCHGGKATPAWSTGTLSIANCTSCHEQGTTLANPQYNSYYSGTKSGINLHALHLNTSLQTIACTDCHNIGTLTNYQTHFSGINTNTFSAPGNTVGNSGSALPTKIGSYTAATQRCSTVACHPDATWTQP